MQLIQVEVYPDKVKLAGDQVVTRPRYVSAMEWLKLWEKFVALTREEN